MCCDTLKWVFMVISTRHHMIGNSSKTDLAVAPLLSTSKLCSKNQSEVVYTLSISYISKGIKKLKTLGYGHNFFL